MTKNENNSHAFLRKMVENIKRTKDAQCPEDTKANEVRAATNAKEPTSIGTGTLFVVFPHAVVSHFQKLYIVCDVALFVIANKSTACHLDCPSDPVICPTFFLGLDKAMKHTSLRL